MTLIRAAERKTDHREIPISAYHWETYPTELYFRTPWDTPLVKPLSVSAGPILITSREAQQRQPLAVLERFDTDVYSFLSFRSAFLPVCLHKHPFFTLTSCLQWLPLIQQTQLDYFNLFGFSCFSLRFLLSPEYFSSRNIQPVYRLYLDSQESRFYKQH